MQPPKKAYRLPRIQRAPRGELVETGENMMWAVSYSDLLMVLLSFFVLFFSYGEKEKETKDSITRMVRRFETVTAPVDATATTVAKAPAVTPEVAPKAEPVAEKLLFLSSSSMFCPQTAFKPILTATASCFDLA